jgi:branched-subunit amino acid ABC-type transport system permease component
MEINSIQTRCSELVKIARLEIIMIALFTTLCLFNLYGTIANFLLGLYLLAGLNLIFGIWLGFYVWRLVRGYLFSRELITVSKAIIRALEYRETEKWERANNKLKKKGLIS